MVSNICGAKVHLLGIPGLAMMSFAAFSGEPPWVSSSFFHTFRSAKNSHLLDEGEGRSMLNRPSRPHFIMNSFSFSSAECGVTCSRGVITKFSTPQELSVNT